MTINFDFEEALVLHLANQIYPDGWPLNKFIAFIHTFSIAIYVFENICVLYFFHVTSIGQCI